MSNVEVCANKTRETERFQDVCLYYFLLRRLFRISSIFHLGGNSQNVFDYCVGLVLLDMGIVFVLRILLYVCIEWFIHLFIQRANTKVYLPNKLSHPYRLAYQYEWFECRIKRFVGAYYRRLSEDLCRQLLELVWFWFILPIEMIFLKLVF